MFYLFMFSCRYFRFLDFWISLNTSFLFFLKILLKYFCLTITESLISYFFSTILVDSFHLASMKWQNATQFQVSFRSFGSRSPMHMPKRFLQCSYILPYFDTFLNIFDIHPINISTVIILRKKLRNISASINLFSMLINNKRED